MDGFPLRVEHVAIVGAGFSGTLQAINLLRHDGPRVTLVERREAFARGVAYSTASPAHMLNVRAANMSAFPDESDHFVRWQAARGRGQPQGFALRRDYGDYLAELLAAAAANAPDRLRLVRATVAEIDVDRDRAVVALSDGERLSADAAVLALGNLPPHDPPGLDGATLPPALYVSDPWAADVAAGLDAEDMVLIVGTGLTMVDVVLTLDTAGVGRRMVALSRRGLVPHPHGDSPPPLPVQERPGGRGSTLLHAVRGRAAVIGWRGAVDELRPHTQGMWLSASPDEQRRFIRHLRPWWDVHRHRLAPPVAERIAELRASGRLRIEAGRLERCEARGAAVDAIWRARGSDRTGRVTAARIINCTGPQGDLLRTREPLLRLLLASGRIRADPHRFGIDVNANAETIDVRGDANPRLLALGPLTRGAFWEIVAVPDIRRQVWAVARRLCNAQWVEGSGL